jgi:hypothetical protein
MRGRLRQINQNLQRYAYFNFWLGIHGHGNHDDPSP